MKDRPYQAEAPIKIREQWASGNRAVLMRLATGGGKTHVFSKMMVRAAEKGMKCAMLVRGVQLVEQASQRLFREEAPHGVLQGDHWNKNANAPIQICSIDTMRRRNLFLNEIKLLVVDEAHLFTTKADREYILQYKNAGVFILAVSATPYTKESLRHLADAVITPITMKELTEQGYLVPIRYFAPSAPDLRGVRTRDGDWVGDELEQRMSTLTGDIIDHWKRIANGLPTLGFAASIHHAQTLAQKCRDAGIYSDYVEGDHNLVERNEAVAKIRGGGILWNVGTMCTGVDIPWLRALIMARPTKSYNLYVQQVGRGTRTFEGKQDCILLDHAGNVLRHGFADDEPAEVDLDGLKKEPAGKTPKLCPKCFIPFLGCCPACGFAPAPSEVVESAPVETKGVLKELRGLPDAVKISIEIRRLREMAARRGYKRGWLQHEIERRFGEEIARTAFPKRRPKIPRNDGGPQEAGE